MAIQILQHQSICSGDLRHKIALDWQSAIVFLPLPSYFLSQQVQRFIVHAGTIAHSITECRGEKSVLALVKTGQFAQEAADAIVVLRFEKENEGKDDSPEIRNALRRAEWTGEKSNLVETFRMAGEREQRVIIAGLGTREKFEANVLRDVSAAVGRRLAQTKDQAVWLDISALFDAETVPEKLTDDGQAWGESLGLLTWDGKTLTGSATKTKPKPEITVSSGNEAFNQGLADGLQLAASVNFARTLSQTPPNIATPLWMAEQAQKLAQETGLECRVIQGDELEAERLNGLITVGKASENPPCLIRLGWTPEKPTGDPPVVIIGKTITYDTGGLTLKVNNGMVGMKRDKDGGCAVLAAMHAVATLIKPDVPVVALLAAAENCVSENSMRPDDVITYRNGVTVEITNTDAEGRLVLADALCWACEIENARAIVDLATLTGGVVTALGSTFAGMFCDDDDLRSDLEAASDSSGERIWRLPLHAEYREMLKSPVADIINSNPNRKAHPIQGAAFLEHFVEDGTAWAHIDIAGVHATDADAGAFIKGPTGWGVRMLAAWLARQTTSV
jgi:leucyl aminopeptidase